MGELADRGWAVLAKTAGGSAATPVSAVLMASGQPWLQALAVPTGLAINAGVEDSIILLRRLQEDARERAERLVAVAEDVSARSFEALLTDAADDPATRELFRRVAEEAVRTIDHRKIDYLARIFVGCADDPARVDPCLILLDLLRQMEAPHLRLLEVLARKEAPRQVHSRAHHVETSDRGKMVNAWSIDDIVTAVPGLAEALDALGGRLVSLGLVYEADQGPYTEAYWALTPLGEQCADFLVDRGKGLDLDS
ncbi:hypothetical protein WEI85_35890 [Actinomycetes bacterium KLBMP 9797]